MTRLVVPAGSVEGMIAATATAAEAVVEAHIRLRHAESDVLTGALETDAASASAVATEVGYAVRTLPPALEQLLSLGRTLGGADQVFTGVERGLFNRPHTPNPLLRLTDLLLTLTLEGVARQLPPLPRLPVDALFAGQGDAVEVEQRQDLGATTIGGWMTGVDDTAAGEITLVALGGGRWVIQLPGIHSLLPGGDPQDVPDAAVALVSRHGSYGRAVVVALQRAAVPPGANLMIVGHSEGGIVAADLAADPAVTSRWHLTHVVAVGAPIDGIAVPASTQLLEVTNRSDLVPQLDGRTAHRAANRTVISFRSEHGDVGRNHELATGYLPFLASPDFAKDPRVQDFSAGAAAYLVGGPTLSHAFAIRDNPPDMILAPGPAPQQASL